MRWHTLLSQIGSADGSGSRSPTSSSSATTGSRTRSRGSPARCSRSRSRCAANRKGHISAALVESVGVSLLFWGTQGVTWAMGLSGRVAPWLAAWAPNVVFLVVGAIAVRRSR